MEEAVVFRLRSWFALRVANFDIREELPLGFNTDARAPPVRDLMVRSVFKDEPDFDVGTGLKDIVGGTDSDRKWSLVALRKG